MTTVTERDGVLIWSISAPVIGQNLVVEIDDRTGTVIRSFTEGVR